MANVLKPEKQQPIRALGRLGWSLRRIEEATGVRRETVSRYLKAAGIALRPERGRVVPSPSNAASHAISDLERSPQPGWSPLASSCEAYREWIESEVCRGRTAKSIWQDLVDDHGFTAGCLSVQRFVRKLRGGAVREARATIVTEPGEEAQVDYGVGPMVRDPETGRFLVPRPDRLAAITKTSKKNRDGALTEESLLMEGGSSGVPMVPGVAGRGGGARA